MGRLINHSNTQAPTYSFISLLSTFVIIKDIVYKSTQMRTPKMYVSVYDGFFFNRRGLMTADTPVAAD